jgi:fructose-1,6-bisphosphatase/inositol monophosphatase family enzyme
MRLQPSLGGISSKDGLKLVAANIVTEADRIVGSFAEDFFSHMFPECLVIHEERTDEVDLGQVRPDTLIFIVDPIDGTLFYAKRSFAWTVSVGCFCGWKPIAGCIYAPQMQHMYYTQESSSFMNGQRIESSCPTGSLEGAVMLRHIKAYHDIDDFPGYTLSYGSSALHLALVASGFACACVTSRYSVYDVAGAVRILENAHAEMRFLNGELPSWEELITQHDTRARESFFACPKGSFDRLSRYVKPKLPTPY